MLDLSLMEAIVELEAGYLPQAREQEISRALRCRSGFLERKHPFPTHLSHLPSSHTLPSRPDLLNGYSEWKMSSLYS